MPINTTFFSSASSLLNHLSGSISDDSDYDENIDYLNQDFNLEQEEEEEEEIEIKKYKDSHSPSFYQSPIKYLHFYCQNEKRSSNTSDSCCSICFDNNELVSVGECGHEFCEVCVKEYILYCLGDISKLKHNVCIIKKNYKEFEENNNNNNNNNNNEERSKRPKEIKSIEVSFKTQTPGIRCPSKDCQYVMDIFSEVSRFVNKKVIEKIQDILTEEWVSDNQTLVPYCKVCNNGTPLSYSSMSPESVFCSSCNVHYCSCCNMNSHKGYTCESWRDKMASDIIEKVRNGFYDEKESLRKEYANSIKTQNFLFGLWMMKNGVRSCPNCFVPIEKNGGCDHMNCRKCNVHYSWNGSLSAVKAQKSWTNKIDMSLPRTLKLNQNEKKTLISVGYQFN